MSRWPKKTGGLARWGALLLLGVFSALLFLPVVAAAQGNDESNLPACCRRGGAHHCAGMAGQSQGDKPGFVQAKAKCPCCPSAPVSGHGGEMAPALSVAGYEGVFGETPLPQPGPGERCRVFDRSKPARGPPTHFLST